MGRVLASQTLVPHPDFPHPALVIAVDILSTDGGGLVFDYTVAGDVTAIRLAQPGEPLPADDLWRTTCFEAFVGTEGSTRYTEFNFAPSRAWACYALEDYRHPPHPACMTEDPVTIETVAYNKIVALQATVPGAALPGGERVIGLSAVIETTDGTKSYWAIRHAPDAPDFHDRETFALQLARPETS